MLNPRYKFAVLLLAAGQSTRFGDNNKLLHPLNGKPLLRHSLDAIVFTNPAQVVVVTGFESERINSMLGDDRVQVITNKDYADGMGTSIAAGAGALNNNIDAAFICLSDMPLLQPQDLDRLSNSFDPQRGHGICVPVFRQRQGHPVLFGRRYFIDLSQLQGDHGARTILTNNAKSIRHIRFNSPHIHADIDYL